MVAVDRFIHGVVWVCRLGVGLAFATLIAAVLVQVVGRGAGASPVWTEELTRFALLFLAAFGAGLSLRTGDLVNVDVICESLPGRAPWALRWISAVITAAVTLLLLPAAWKFVSIGAFQTSPALGLRMSVAHFSVMLMLALLAVFAILRVIGMSSGVEDGVPRRDDEEGVDDDLPHRAGEK